MTTRNPNRNVVTTVVLHDGTERVLSHRNTVVSFARALTAAGLTAADVADSFPGLPESARVGA